MRISRGPWTFGIGGRCPGPCCEGRSSVRGSGRAAPAGCFAPSEFETGHTALAARSWTEPGPVQAVATRRTVERRWSEVPGIIARYTVTMTYSNCVVDAP